MIRKVLAETIKETLAETIKEALVETIKETLAETIKEALAETIKETLAETIKEALAETIKEALAETIIQEINHQEDQTEETLHPTEEDQININTQDKSTKMKSPKAVITSLIALIFIILTFTTNWLFIIPAAILSWYGWKILLN